MMNIAAKKISVICCLLLYSACGLAIPARESLTDHKSSNSGIANLRPFNNGKLIYQKLYRFDYSGTFDAAWALDNKLKAIEEYRKKYHLEPSEDNGYSAFQNEEIAIKQSTDANGNYVSYEPAAQSFSSNKCQPKAGAWATSLCWVAKEEQECSLTAMSTLETGIVRLLRLPYTEKEIRDSPGGSYNILGHEHIDNTSGGTENMGGRGEGGDWYVYVQNGQYGRRPIFSWNCTNFTVMEDYEYLQD